MKNFDTLKALIFCEAESNLHNVTTSYAEINISR